LTENKLRDLLQDEENPNVDKAAGTNEKDETVSVEEAADNGEQKQDADKVIKESPTANAEAAKDNLNVKAETETPVKDPKDVEIENLQKQLLRLQADFENFRRRNTAEKAELSTFVTINVVGRFLKILDNFERASVAAQKTEDIKSIITGMENVHRLFLQTITELGVKEIPALNQKFDPKLHEAVMRGQNPDLEDDTVDAVFEKGYELNNHVIRHSKVRVINNS
jgi:molecular chaperone GrpE